jgi:hypothetical protein
VDEAGKFLDRRRDLVETGEVVSWVNGDIGRESGGFLFKDSHLGHDFYLAGSRRWFLENDAVHTSGGDCILEFRRPGVEFFCDCEFADYRDWSFNDPI